MAANKQLPVMVSPFHDPDGWIYNYLRMITPTLKRHFAKVFLSISPPTQQRQPEMVAWAQADPFFAINFNRPETLPGDHYLSGYRHAVEAYVSDRIFHLCDLDRIAFALNTSHRNAYLADVQFANAKARNAPVLFQRSEQAWSTYPKNYRRIEHLIIQVGELLFSEMYDFAWSYMVMRSGQLETLLPNIKSHDFGILIEIVLMLREQLVRKSVDWLAWEDPYIFGRDPGELRQARDSSREETWKRLRGMLPFFEHFLSVISPLSPEQGWDKHNPA
jgi:hypothetical protein